MRARNARLLYSSQLCCQRRNSNCELYFPFVYNRQESVSRANCQKRKSDAFGEERDGVDELVADTQYIVESRGKLANLADECPS